MGCPEVFLAVLSATDSKPQWRESNPLNNKINVNYVYRFGSYFSENRLSQLHRPIGYVV
jgi:hypothetical protein